VNGLGWTSGLSFLAHGVTVGIRTNQSAAWDQIIPLLPPGWRPVTSRVVDHLYSVWMGPEPARQRRRTYHLVYYGARRLKRTVDPGELFMSLENLLTLIVAYWAQPDRVFVHAGVVGWRGRAIVIPGRSHTGKTTLVAELLKAGATYFSDEMAVFDAGGLVHPFPVPLTVRQAGGRCKEQPAAYGSRASVAPLPVESVVVTQYEADARWRPRRLTPAQTFMALLDNTVAARRNPKAYFPILGAVARQAQGHKSKRGEAASVVKDILATALPGVTAPPGPSDVPPSTPAPGLL
jgi:hypothetical protein